MTTRMIEIGRANSTFFQRSVFSTEHFRFHFEFNTLTKPNYPLLCSYNAISSHTTCVFYAISDFNLSVTDNFTLNLFSGLFHSFFGTSHFTGCVKLSRRRRGYDTSYATRDEIIVIVIIPRNQLSAPNEGLEKTNMCS